MTRKFRKYHIDGQALMALTHKTLKEKLKIDGNDGIGLRLELMAALVKLKSNENYPSPLLNDEYPLNDEYKSAALPGYYPFDYQYRVNQMAIDTNQHSQNYFVPNSTRNNHHNHRSDKPIFTRDVRRRLLSRSANIRKSGNGYSAHQ